MMDFSVAYFGALVLFVASSHAAGLVLQRLTLRGVTLSVASSMLIGSIFLISIFAILKTGGQSIFLLVFPLLWFAAREEQSERTETRIGVVAGLVLSLLFAFLFFKVRYGFEKYGVGHAWIDDSYYSRLAQVLSLNGVENSHVGSYFKSSPPSPYHYLELWATALIADTLQLNYYQTLRLVVTPFFLFAFIIRLAEAVPAGNAMYRYAIGILCSSGLLLVLPPNDIPYLRNLESDLLAHAAAKAAPAMALMAAGSLALLRGRIPAALAWFTLCAIASFALYGVIAGMMAMILLYRFIEKPDLRKHSIPMLVAALLVAVPAFYLLREGSSTPSAGLKLDLVPTVLSGGVAYWKYRLPSILLILGLYYYCHASGNRTHERQLLLGIGLGSVFGMAISSIFPGEKDAHQFFDFATDCALRATSAVLLAQAFGKLAAGVRGVSPAAGILLVAMLANFGSTTFVSRINSRWELTPALVQAAADISRSDLLLTFPTRSNAHHSEYFFNWHVDSMGYLDPFANSVSLPANDLRSHLEGFRDAAALAPDRIRAIEANLLRHPIMRMAIRNQWSYQQSLACFVLQARPKYALSNRGSDLDLLPEAWLRPVATDTENDLTLYRIEPITPYPTHCDAADLPTADRPAPD